VTQPIPPSSRRPGRSPRIAGAAAGRPWQASTGGLSRGARSIGGRLDDLERRQITLTSATVTASTSTTATIDYHGTTLSDVNMLASYTPTTGDTVLLLQAPGMLIIIGKAK
jgi:hypothetical protein